MAQMLSPGGWLELLCKKLDAQWDAMAPYDAYFEGDQNLAFATSKWREAFGSLFAQAVSNWCPLIVESRVERISVQGIRFDDSEDADERAWEVWQENGLDDESDQLHEEAIKLGQAFWLVEPVAGGVPRVTVEHPSQVVVVCAAGNRRQRLAALKRWWDDDGYVYATLYLPDRIHKFRSSAKARAGMRVQWTRRPGDEGGLNPLGEVPVIPVRNQPRMLGGGRSELHGAIPLQDALNKLFSDMLIGSEYQAYPQRVLMGVEAPKDPATGQPLVGAQLTASQSRLWMFDNENAKVSEFSAHDLKSFTGAREHLTSELMAQNRLPAYYVSRGQVVNVSAEALRALDAGLVKTTRRKFKPFGESHEDMFRLVFKAMGDEERSRAAKAEIMWENPEIRSQAELADSLTKLGSGLHIPDRFLWEEYGFSPQQIDRMEDARVEQALLGAVTNPNPATDAPTQPSDDAGE